MDSTVVGPLLGPRARPAVSIGVPLDRRRPGNATDRRRLLALAEQARERIGNGADGTAAEVARRIDDAVGAVDLRHPADGVLIFVAPGETHVLPVDFVVPERVDVDAAFSVRDLVRGLGRTVPHRVLVLGEESTRLLESDGHHLTEPAGRGFPVACPGVDDAPLESGGYAVHTDRPDALRHAFWREVDRALGAADGPDPRPLVVVGSPRDLVGFRSASRHTASIVGTVTGDHHHDPPTVLEQLVRPVVADHLAQWRSVLVAELVESIGTDRAVTGLDPTRAAARAGRVDTLVIDDAAPPTRDVEDLIADVLDHRGHVTVVDPGGLGALAPAAARLRT